MPRVSVIIPTYNRPDLLRHTLKSVSDQTFTDFEIIFVDDGSVVAGVEEVCREFPGCRYILQENQGRSSARNRGIMEAKGDLIAFVDDDDLWKPEKLEKQVAFLDRNPHVGLVHSPTEKMSADGTSAGELIGSNNPEWRKGNVFRYAVRGCVVKSGTPLVRGEVFKRCGYFDPDLHTGEDWEFWARVAYRYEFGVIPEPLAYCRIHDGSLTRQDLYMKVPSYMATKLCAYVEPGDRPLVRRQCCMAYLGTIGRFTGPQSAKRLRHLWKALLLWPPCIFQKSFWGLLLLSR